MLEHCPQKGKVGLSVQREPSSSSSEQEVEAMATGTGRGVEMVRGLWKPPLGLFSHRNRKLERMEE